MAPFETAVPAATQAWIRATLAAGTARNTRKSYDQDRRFFEAWAKARYGAVPALPVPPAVALTFVADCLGAMPKVLDEALVAQGIKTTPGPLSTTTVQRRLTGLQDWQVQAGFAGVFRGVAIRQLLRRAKRIHANRRKKRSQPITWNILVQLLATCTDSLQGQRDRALLLVGFLGGGRRRSELRALDISDLHTVGDQTLLHIRTSKTDQVGHGLWVPLTDRVVLALRAWLHAAGIKEGALFRSIDRHGNVGERLSDGGINDIIKVRCDAAGLDPQAYSAHGLRSGFLTECELRGLPLNEAMALTGHTSAATAIDYWRQTGQVKGSIFVALQQID